MKSFLAWFTAERKARPWLLVGKGPSFDRRHEIPVEVLGNHLVLGLNHVCLRQTCDLTHFTDWDAFRDCASVLLEQTCSVVLPWHPHVDNRPGRKSLARYFEEDEDLRRIGKSGRLFSYNSSLSREQKPGLVTVLVRYFSAVAGLNLLAIAGVKTVRTLGIDGGRRYSQEFDPATLLTNGRTSFDVQFREMHRTAKRHKMFVSPILEMS